MKERYLSNFVEYVEMLPAGRLQRKGGDVRMEDQKSAGFSLPESAFVRFTQDLCVESAGAICTQLAPALIPGSTAISQLLRARPSLMQKLRRGEAISLPLDGFSTGAGALMLALFPRPDAPGYLGALTRTEADPALRGNLTARLREPIAEVFALLPMLANQLEAGRDPSVLIRLNECCYQLLRDTSVLSQFSQLINGSWHPAQTTDLCSVVEGVCSAAKGILLPGQPSVQWEVPRCTLPVRCPSDLLSTMVCALLSNALRFTRDGNEITVSLTPLEHHALLRVRDRGIGIRPEVLPRIFDPFFSADPYEDTAPAPGAGLGLSFVQALAGRMEGTVSVESVFGEGSLFAVSLPLDEGEIQGVLSSASADYLLNRYSPVYLQLAGFCRLPDPS